VTEQECGISPDGGALCRWSISFDGLNYTWRHSDLVESDFYFCRGNTVTGMRTGGGAIIAEYDAGTQTLTWVNLAYMLQ
jgi:hypothetical protein